jgi:predicted ATPase
MPRYVLTGSPGAGKTAVLRLLEFAGHVVVEEAATDVIAAQQARGQPEPWTSPGFVETVVSLQRRRQIGLCAAGQRTVFFDRSPVCTLALCRFLGLAVPALLTAELDRMARDGVYDPTVFFVRSLGFVTATAARRISLADSLAFEKVHEQVYSEFGFRLVDVPAGPAADRVALVLRQIKEENHRMT